MDPIPLNQLAVWHHTSKQGSPKARILIIHGIGEHSGRHENTYRYLTDQGYEVVRFDLRGSGKSGGRRQWVQSFDDYVNDVIQVYNWIETKLSKLPLFVLGHSLGGAIATFFSATYSKHLQGLILSAPAYKVGGAISPVMIQLGKLLERLTPTLKVPKAGDMSAVSRDPRVVKEYEQDPLACHFNTVQQGNVVLRALEQMPKQASHIDCPILIVHGTADRIILLEGSYELLQSVKSKDKTFHIIPGGYHEPHNDYDKENYFIILEQWLSKHLSQ